MPTFDLASISVDYLLNRALALVPDTLDKRQGSVIYDALAPCCHLMMDYYIKLRNAYLDTYALTATGDALDKKTAEHGIIRFPASAAVKIGVFKDEENSPILIPLGSRFSIVSEDTAMFYYAYDVLVADNAPVPGSYLLRCETPGVVGTTYTGPLSSINYISRLHSAEMTSIYLAGEDAESDEDLRTRFFYLLQTPPFAGNVSAYYSMIKGLPDIGAVQVYPTWNGGGTVKCSILNSSYGTASQQLLDYVKNEIDPSDYEGNGWGLAPIGHSVTISTPDEITVNIEFTIELANGILLAQAETAIQSAISAYLYSLRENWDIAISRDNYYCNVYRSQIVSAILSVTGVVNVTDLTINEMDADLVLAQTGITQEIPVLGDVTINDSISP